MLKIKYKIDSVSLSIIKLYYTKQFKDQMSVPTPIYARLLNIIRTGRRCLYCNNNHDVSACDDNRLYMDYLTLVNKKYEIMDDRSLTMVQMMCIYSDWLKTLNPNLIICCARKFCASHSIVYSECLKNVIIKVWNYPNPSREEIDFIPFQENPEDILQNYEETLDYFYNTNSQQNIKDICICIECCEYKNSYDNLRETECTICYETTSQNNMVILNCNHSFCYKCIIESNKNKDRNNDLCCAICRVKIINIQCNDTHIKNILENL